MWYLVNEKDLENVGVTYEISKKLLLPERKSLIIFTAEDILQMEKIKPLVEEEKEQILSEAYDMLQDVECWQCIDTCVDIAYDKVIKRRSK